MGRGGRKNRKRRRPDDAAAAPVPPQLQQQEHLDVSFWANDHQPEGSSSSSSTPPIIKAIPAELLAIEASNVETVPAVPEGIDRYLWKDLQSTWASLLRRHPTWTAPTTVQRQAWSVLLQSNKSNLLQISPTGSGKTNAYGLPMVLQLLNYNRGGRPTNNSSPSSAADEPAVSAATGLCLVPTRELALQVQKSILDVTRCLPTTNSKDAASQQSTTSSTSISVVACYGGVDKQAQLDALLAADRRPLIVTATTGRLLDLLEVDDNGSSSSLMERAFSNVRMVVLDEADRLALNRDLCEQVNQILELLRRLNGSEKNSNSAQHTTVLCSATWPGKVTEPWRQWVFGASNTSDTSSPHARCVVVKVDAMTVKQQTSPTKKSKQAAEDDDNDVKPSKSQEEMETSSDAKTTTNNGTAATTADRSLLLSRIPANLTQTLHVCAEHKKAKKLLHTLQNIYKQEQTKRSRSLGIIFCATIQKVQYLAKLLSKESSKIIPPCAELHSKLRSQSERESVVRNFQCGKVPLLLATDLAARGLHVHRVRFVLNFDFPTNLEQYVHRCGRAGRGGSSSNTAAAASNEALETATVYSFFTRNLAPMAADVVALLEAGNQVVDPNLRALVDGGGKEKRAQHSQPTKDMQQQQQQQRQQRKSKPRESKSADAESLAQDDSNADEDDDPFQHLSATRIALKRAPGISDASSSDDDGA